MPGSTLKNPWRPLIRDSLRKSDVRGYRTCAQSVVDRLSPGSSVLEVAPGPGYLAIEIAKRGQYRMVGLDISHSFVR